MEALEGSATRPVRAAFVDWARRRGVEERGRSSRRARALRIFLILTVCGVMKLLRVQAFGKERMAVASGGKRRNRNAEAQSAQRGKDRDERHGQANGERQEEKGHRVS
jgi:hypothetical protein